MTEKQFLLELREKNKERQQYWVGSEKIDVLFRTVEFVGEAGEVANAIKKIHRARNDIAGNSKNIDELMENLTDEIGDVIITIDLLANEFGIDLAEAVRSKFNKTSEKISIPVTM